MPSRVFICHSSPASDEAAGVVRAQAVEGIRAAGFEVLADREGLRVGDDWFRRIVEWLDRCDASVILLGLPALRSSFVPFEVAHLISRHVRQPAFPVLPVLVAPVDPATIRAYKWTRTYRLPDLQALSSRDAGWVEMLVETLRCSLKESPSTEPALLPLPFSGLERMVEDYAIFGGRSDVLRQLDDFVLQDGRRRALLTARTGRGKTALLIHWVLRLQADERLFPVFAPISRRYNTATDREFSNRLIAALQRCHDEPPRPPILRPDHAPSVIRDYLRRSPPADRRLVVVIDGLDEAVGWTPDPQMFPTVLPERVWVVASAREKARMDREAWCEQLDWPPARTAFLTVDPLTREEIREAVQQAGFENDEQRSLTDRIAQISEGDPFELKRILKDSVRGAAAIRPDGDFRDLLKRAEDPRVNALLCLLSAAFGPLTGEEIRALTPGDFRNKSQLTNAAEIADRWLVGNGTAEAGFDISHERIRERLLEELFDPADLVRMEKVFVDWGKAACAAVPDPVPQYLRLYWIVHLERAGAWDEMKRVLTGVEPGRAPVWARTRFAAEQSYLGFITDLSVLQRHAEKQEDFALALRCALIAASLGTLAERMLPELLAGLVAVGTTEQKWPAVVALDYVELMGNDFLKASAIEELVATRVPVPYERLIEMAWRLEHTAAQARVLGAVAADLPDKLIPEALALAERLPPWAAAETFAAYAPRLPPRWQSETIGRLKAGRFDRGTPTLFRALLGCVPAESFEPFDWIDSFPDEIGPDLIDPLADRLAAEKWPPLIQAAARRGCQARVRIYSAIASAHPALVTILERPLIDTVCEWCAESTMPQGLTESLRRIPALGLERLAGIPNRLQLTNESETLAALVMERWPAGDLVPGAFEIACGYTSPQVKMYALTALGIRMEGQDADTVWAAAVETLRELDPKSTWMWAGDQLGRAVPVKWASAALEAARDVGLADRVLRGMVARSGELRSLNLVAACADVPDTRMRAHLLRTLLESTPALQPRAFELALRTLDQIPAEPPFHDDRGAARLALSRFARDAGERFRLQRSALEDLGNFSLNPLASATEIVPELIVPALENCHFRANAIAMLAPRAPVQHRATILERCLAIEDPGDRARSLIALGLALADDAAELLAGDRVFEAIEAVFAPREMADLWQSLRALPPVLQMQLFQFMTSRVPAFKDQYRLASTAADLVRYGSPPLRQRVAERVRRSPEQSSRLLCIGELAREAPDAMLHELLAAVLDVGEVGARQWGWSLVPLLARVEGPDFEALWSLIGSHLDWKDTIAQIEGLSRASTASLVLLGERLQDESARTDLIRQLASRLDTGERHELLRAACAIAQQGGDPEQPRSASPTPPAISLSERLAALMRQMWDESELGLHHLEWVTSEMAVVFVAFEARASRTDARVRSKLLQLASPRLPEEMLSAASRVARSLAGRPGAAAHLALSRRLSGHERNAAGDIAIASVDRAGLDIEGVRWMARLLQELPAERIGEAADAVLANIERSRESDFLRYKACPTIFPHVPQSHVERAATLARSFAESEPAWAAALLAELLPSPGSQVSPLLAEVVDLLARSIENRPNDERSRRWVREEFASVAAAIETRLLPEAAARVLDLARMIEVPQTLATVSLRLLGALETARRRELFDSAIALGELSWRTLASCIERLPSEFRAECLRIALRRFDDEHKSGLQIRRAEPELELMFRPCANDVSASEVADMIHQLKSVRKRWEAFDAAVRAGIRLPVQDAFEVAFKELDDRICLQTLRSIAELCEKNLVEIPLNPAGVWSSALRRLATRGRSAVLSGTVSLLPLAKRTSRAETIDDAVRAVLDVGDAWP